MNKLLKWDLVDLLNRTPILWVGMGVSLLAALIPQDDSTWINVLLIILSPMIGFLVFQSLIVFAVYQPVGWLRRDSFLLETSIPLQAWKKLLSKLILSIGLNLLAFVYVIQLFDIIGRMAGGSLSLITLDQLRGIPTLVLAAFLIDTTVMFSYIAAGSWSFTRRVKWLAGGVYCLLILSGLTAIILVWMLAAGTVMLPTISAQNIITFDGSFQILSTTIPLVVCLLTILFEFTAGSILLTHHYQKD